MARYVKNFSQRYYTKEVFVPIVTTTTVVGCVISSSMSACVDREKGRPFAARMQNAFVHSVAGGITGAAAGIVLFPLIPFTPVGGLELAYTMNGYLFDKNEELTQKYDDWMYSDQ